MLGRLVYETEGRGRAERVSLYGLPVIQASVDPDGWLGESRLKRAGRTLARHGVTRVLAPVEFDRWALLERYGLGPVDPLPLLRACAAPLALAALRELDVRPAEGTVALLGARADADLIRAARELCPRVRRLVISAPRGGAELAAWLHREYGVPVSPADAPVHVALRFGPGEAAGKKMLNLSGPGYALGGLTLRAPVLKEGDREDIFLLAALWQGEKLKKEGIECT